MAVDPIRRYMDAKAALDSAEKQVTNLSSYLSEVANALKANHWNFMVSNVSVGFPAELLGAPSMDAKKWPSAQQIAETLAKMHTARHEALNAWSNLSAPDRANLTPPPGGR